MRHTRTAMLAGTLALGLMAACTPATEEPTDAENGTDAIAGTYTCAPNGDLLELRDDGSVILTPQGAGAPPAEEGTWSAAGSGGTFDFGAFQDSFTVEGNAIVFAHAGAPEGEEFVCTSAP